MRILYLDCFSGASGDMLLGAFLDAGLPMEELRAALGSLAIDGYDLSASRVSRAGIAATKFSVLEPRTSTEAPGAHPHRHDHAHTHGHGHDEASTRVAPAHGHHAIAEIKARIGRSGLPAATQTRAAALFDRLADVEAEIHQMPVEQIHLHEVGALDSIIDIVGAVFALDWFAADVIVASPLNVGGGTVQCAHGTFPVPAPATARLLEGIPIYSSGAQIELVTPTGALLVTAAATRYGPIPPMRIDRIGYGAGARELAGTPNVLRVLVGTSIEEIGTDPITTLQFEVDDMNPQIFGALMDRLYEAGAVEVMYSPVQMKKNRPGTFVTILTQPEGRDALLDIVFRETTTLGVRFQDVQRECLAREVLTVTTPVGEVRMKIARRRGVVVNAQPEFEDCARLARQAGASVKEVQAMASRAYLDRDPPHRQH
jgi:hypothetical protein